MDEAKPNGTLVQYVGQVLDGVDAMIELEVVGNELLGVNGAIV